MQRRLRALLGTYLNDNRQAWELGADGVWVQREPDGVPRPSHEILVKNSWGMLPETPAVPTAPRAQPARTSGD